MKLDEGESFIQIKIIYTEFNMKLKYEKLQKLLIQKNYKEKKLQKLHRIYYKIKI